MIFWNNHFSKSEIFNGNMWIAKIFFLVDKFPSVVVSALIMLISFDLDHSVFSKHFETQKFAFRPEVLIFFSHFLWQEFWASRFSYRLEIEVLDFGHCCCCHPLSLLFALQ